MSTVNTTILGGGGIQGFVDLNTGSLSVDYYSPLHGLRFIQSLPGIGDEEAQQASSTNSWGALGVPANSNVTAVQLISAQVRIQTGDGSPINLGILNISQGGDTLSSTSIDTGDNTVPTDTVYPRTDTDLTDARFDLYCSLDTSTSGAPIWVIVSDIVVQITYSPSIVFVSTGESTPGSESASISAQVAKPEIGAGNENFLLVAKNSVSELVPGSEIKSVTGLISATESGAGSESSSVGQGGSLAESGAGSETRTIIVTLSQSESAPGNETTVALVVVGATETGAGSETKNAFPLGLSAAESGGGAETTSLFQGAGALGIGETLTINESFAITVMMDFTDQGAGSENAANDSSFIVRETGAGGEGLFIYDLTNPPRVGDRTFVRLNNSVTIVKLI